MATLVRKGKVISHASAALDRAGILYETDSAEHFFAGSYFNRFVATLQILGAQAADEYKYHSFKPKAPDADAVQIMTIHKAKGLVFHTVFLPEITKREFPVSNMGGKQDWHVLDGVFEENKDKYRSDLDAERKLFYVAVTRAKQNLYITYKLSAQPSSYFVKESADSHYLKINRSDLT